MSAKHTDKHRCYKNRRENETSLCNRVCAAYLVHKSKSICYRMKRAKLNHHSATVAVGNAKYKTDKRIYDVKKATIFRWSVESGEQRVMGCRMM